MIKIKLLQGENYSMISIKQLSRLIIGATTIASTRKMSALSAKAATFTYSDSTFNNEN
ncbi:MAG: hypothetical protein O4861_16350 [Trichodesmium sp. St16_bin4-tuft]|nr:hypothetical protein [Trichodesmium sp. MAG_R01]MDE5074318.1 hypothetical protein [Trichodesmium sp. St5_bin8]MDE5099816.1 hypothetical protein [Trichodesmium sp. St16_bin4-tuft]